MQACKWTSQQLCLHTNQSYALKDLKRKSFVNTISKAVHVQIKDKRKKLTAFAAQPVRNF